MKRTLQTASAAAALDASKVATLVKRCRLGDSRGAGLAGYIAPDAALEDVYAAMTPQWRAKAQQIAAERARFSVEAVPALHAALESMPAAGAAASLNGDGTVDLGMLQLPALGEHLARVAATRAGEPCPSS